MSIKNDIKISMFIFSSLLISLLFSKVNAYSKDTPCVWDSYTGAKFDLRPLMKQKDEESYAITDGDDPCTKSREQEYDYNFNFCQDVTGDLPELCSEDETSSGTRCCN